MSDAQPRKRRDKKKKKDEDEVVAPRAPRAPSLTPLDNDDVNIHEHKEGGTGGGICAKLVFFALLSALAILIGLIITEQRGLTDLDTIEKESRFSQYFEGWVDNALDDHDHHYEIAEDDHDDLDEHDDHDKENEEAVSEEEMPVSEEEKEEIEAEESEIDDSIQEDTPEEEDEEEVEEDTEEGDEGEGTEEYEEASQEDEEEEEQEDEVESPQDYEEEEDDDEAKSEEPQESKGDSNDDEGRDNVSEALRTEEGQDEEDQEDEVPASPEQDKEPIASNEKVAGDDEEDDAESIQMADTDAVEWKEEAVDGEVDEVEREGEEQPINVVKATVGLVILVVAYIVLIRKWKSDEAEEVQSKKEVTQDRRNTIVVPPKVEEVDLGYDNYSEGEEEEPYDDEEEEEEYEVKFDQQGKTEYQKLRNTYEGSLTLDSEKFDKNEPDDDYEEELGSVNGEEEEENMEEIERADEEEEEYDPDEEEIVVEVRFDDDYDPEYDDEEIERQEGLVFEDEGEEEEEEDDEELMKKLEEKYGKLLGGPQPSGEEDCEEGFGQRNEEGFDPEEEEDDGFLWRHGGAQEVATPEEEPAGTSTYVHKNITNDDDFAIFDQLDEAQDNLNVNAALALSQFAAILKSYPRSPRGLYGRARALDLLAEQQQSNQLLTEAITNYHALMTLEDIPEVLLKMAADRCINRLRFMGQYSKAIEIHRLMIKRFPTEITYRNQLAVTFLTTNRMEDARNELQLSLQRWPYDGFALVHYGFILKVHDGHLEPAVNFLQRGIATRDEGVLDGRFYFHLGDALDRLGRHDEANAVYEDGAKQKVFLSATQRSLYNVPTLKAQPWWHQTDMPLTYQQFFMQLERNFMSIRDEGLAVMKARGLFQDEAENLRDKGDWKQFELFARGMRNKKHCEKCPLTCKLVQSLPEAVGCRRGQVKFSVMLPGTHVWPHCGPTNCRLRAHLGLKVPGGTFIRVDRQIRSWKEGKIMIFDDSFEHEVWHNGTDIRLVLIVDVWHPELSSLERRTLPAI